MKVDYITVVGLILIGVGIGLAIGLGFFYYLEACV